MIRRLHLVPVVALVGAALWGGVRAAHRAGNGTVAALSASAFSERPQRDTQIAVWGKALAADSTSALVLTQLAGLHLQRSREGGGWSDILTAEAFARRSLASRVYRNGAASATLVATLVAQHRFSEAEGIAREMVARDPDLLEYHAILAEVAMERGNYALAGEEFKRVRPLRTHLSVAPRLARWHELRGEVSESRRLLTDALDEAWRRTDVPTEVKAWFALRLGEFERRADRPNRAESAFRRGLEIEPEDSRLLAAMTRLSAARGDAQAVVDWGERAIGAELDPELILLLAGAHSELGRAVQAQELRAAFDVAVSARSGPFHRTWSLALLDRGERVGEVLERVEEELRDRKDIYAYDLLAWALLKSDRPAEAKVAMTQALQLGTQDPLLRAHAAAIDSAIDASVAAALTSALTLAKGAR